jgi:hypothetical protein
VTVAAVVIWYDENPEDITRMVRSMGGLCDYMVAVDGVFRNFPDAKKAWSDKEQIAAFSEACGEVGIELLVYQPKAIGRWLGRFKGEEVPKRNASFNLCSVFQPTWVIVCDADMECIAKNGARELLEWTDKSVAVTDVGGFQHRHVFRWSPNLMYLKAHYVCVDGNRTLAHPPSATSLTTRLPDIEPSLDLFDVLRFDHIEKSDFWRRAQAESYYIRRDESHVESLYVDTLGGDDG